MEKLFFILDKYEQILVATIEYKNETYIYQPRDLDKSKVLIYGKRIVSKNPPHILTSRTVSPGRDNLNVLLDRIGIEKFDLWELIKYNDGKVRGDNILFLTRERMYELNLQHLIPEEYLESRD